MERVAFGSRMREIDGVAINERGIPGITLMENAGVGLTQVILETLESMEDDKKNCVIICGAGNNGGDGYVAARLLCEAGKNVDLYSTVDPLTLKGDAKINYERYIAMDGEVKNLKEEENISQMEDACRTADIIVDSVLGTGISREVAGLSKRVIDIINQYGRGKIISVDIPSGVGADNGKIYGAAVRADKTVTFQLNKVGMCIEPGRSMAGETIVIDIEIPADIYEASDEGILYRMDKQEAVKTIPERTPWMNKGDAGKVLIVAGSPGMAGAAALAAKGAYRSGAGLVKLAAEKEVLYAANYQISEITGLILTEDVNNNIELISEEAKNYDAMVVGPGLGQSDAAAKMVEHIVQNIDKPIVLDADGINIAAKNPEILKRAKGRLIMTPHPGEMGRLIKKTPAEVNEDRLTIAQSFAKEYNVTLILKGAASIIALPDGITFINPTGNSAMATAGSGDVLSGIIAAFAAAGLDWRKAAVLGAYIHGMSGDMCSDAIGEYGTTASDIATFSALALKKLTMSK